MTSRVPASSSSPSLARVPARRTTTGTFTSTSEKAARRPLATSSPRVIPPKTLSSIDFTSGSERTMRKAFRTTSAFARLDVQSSPAVPAALNHVSVVMTRPAPLPMMPTSLSA